MKGPDCRVCGKTLNRVWPDTASTTCSEQCRKALRAQEQRGYSAAPHAPNRTCDRCGKRYYMKMDTRRKDDKALCSRECKLVHRTANKKPDVPRSPDMRECIICGVLFVRRGNGWTCSEGCWQKAKEQAYREWYSRWYTPRRGQATCRGCGQSFEQRHGLQGYCSPHCKPQYTSPIALDVLGERDGWRCHLCGRRVRRIEATADHLIPRSHGGGDDPINLRLAHRSCNSSRGAGRTPAQLVLIG